MAGFAVVMTILSWGVVGIALTGAASIALFVVARRQVRSGEPVSRHFVAISAGAPILALAWLVAALLLHVQISNRLAHQDCGLSGDPYVTLPNGYVVGSLNTYDGYVVAPGFETGVPRTGPGYVRSLITVEYVDGVFRGTYSNAPTADDTGGSTSAADVDVAHGVRSFVFDTRDRSIVTKSTDDALNFGSVQDRVHADAASYWNLYARYRPHWPNYVLLALIATGEGLILYWVWQLWEPVRRSRRT
jgi:hypothetical protein